MTATNHALTGATIATLIKQPFLALPLALISHFVCDAIPHFDINIKFNSKAMYIWLTLDGMAALFMAGLLLTVGVRNPLLLALSGFIAMSPDFAWFIYGLKNKLGKVKSYDPITRFHHKIQWYHKKPGLIVEFLWAFMMVITIIKSQTV